MVQVRVLLAMLLLAMACSGTQSDAPSAGEYPPANYRHGSLTKVRLSNTHLPRDTDGNLLVTGETSVLQPTAGDGEDTNYYMYVNDWGNCSNFPGIDTCSSVGGCASCARRSPQNCIYDTTHVVQAYRTPDFSTFYNLGVVLPLSARHPGYLFRPHVVYNRKTATYVMWFEDHSTNTSIHGMYHVATSKAPGGPFAVVSSNVSMPFGPYPVMHVGDFDLFVDDDGEAYHVRTGFSVVRLRQDYLAPMEVVSSLTTPKPSEAPTMFKRKGTYYIMAGTSCCACPGGSNLFVFTAPSPRGPWSARGDVGSNTTAPFDLHSRWNYVTRSQASAVFSVPNKVAAGLSLGGSGDSSNTRSSSSGGSSGSGGGGGGNDPHRYSDAADVATFVWLGNQWVTGSDRSHDLLYWTVLTFDDGTSSNGGENKEARGRNRGPTAPAVQQIIYSPYAEITVVEHDKADTDVTDRAWKQNRTARHRYAPLVDTHTPL